MESALLSQFILGNKMAPHVNKINNLHHQDNSNNLNQVNSQIEDLNS